MLVLRGFFRDIRFMWHFATLEDTGHLLTPPVGYQLLTWKLTVHAQIVKIIFTGKIFICEHGTSICAKS